MLAGADVKLSGIWRLIQITQRVDGFVQARFTVQLRVSIGN